MAKLKLEIHQNAYEVFEIKEKISLGRELENDIILLDGIISRTHALVYRDEDKYIIEDLDSSNGIYINDEKVLVHTLEDNDIIQIGKTVLSFSLDKMEDPQVIIDLVEVPLEGFNSKRMIEAPDVLFRFPSETEIMEQVYEIAQEKFDILDGLTGLEKGKLFNILHEAVGNAQRHGHKYESNLPIEFRYLVKPNKLIMEITDQGDGFNYHSELRDKEGISAVEAARKRYLEGGIGGLGIILMLACVDELEYNSLGNQITLTKWFHKEESPAPALV